MKLTYRLLGERDLPALYQAFTLAFSSNAVPFKPTYDHFRVRILSKLGVSFEHSQVAIDPDGVLIGFNLHTVREFDGKLTAYNGGMGVIPSLRRQGIARKLYENLAPGLQMAGINRVLLEVTTSNKEALGLYRRLGFSVRRRLKCFKSLSKLNHQVSGTFELRELSTIPQDVPHDYQPTFIDSSNQLLQNSEHEKGIGGFIDNRLCGYVIWQPHLGRISQLFVWPEFRNLGLGRTLLKTIHTASSNPITLMNVPEEQSETVAFLEKSGFINEIDQFEMELII